MSYTRIGKYTIDLEAVKKLSKKDLKAFLANKPLEVVEAVEKVLDTPKKKREIKEGGN